MLQTWKRVIIAFLLSFIAFFIFDIFFPRLHLTYFAPFLIITYYEKDKTSALWLSLVCGLIIDCLSSQAYFGIFALNYCLTTMLIYEFKPFFFEDAITTIPVMTSCFCFFSTILHFILLHIFDIGFTMTWKWLAIDAIMMSIVDGLYGLALFVIPFLFIKRGKINRSKYVFNKRTRQTLHKKDSL